MSPHTTIIRETHLDGMTTEEAIAFVRARMDRDFAADAQRQDQAMRADGLDRETRAGILDEQWAFHVEWRNQHLDELHAALLKHDGKLN